MRFVALSLLACVLLIGGIGWDSTPNKTEVGHMAAANDSWRTLRFDVFAVNPPLARMIAGVPVALWPPQFTVANSAPRPQDRPEWAMGAAFLKANSPEEIRRCFLLARWSLIPGLLLGGYFGYQLSHEIYGRPSAFIYMALWCASPLMDDPQRPTDYTGLWVVHHGRGARTETEYVDGVANGAHRLWGEKGVCLREASVKGGQWHGTMIIRHSDGTVLDVSEFEDGTGTYRIYSSDGRLIDEIPLLHGKRHGVVRCWRRGKLVVTRFDEGKPCDPVTRED